jgi:hypothetical protein
MLYAVAMSTLNLDAHGDQAISTQNDPNSIFARRSLFVRLSGAGISYDFC